MFKESKPRKGIDDRPVAQEEYLRMKVGKPLYERVVAPEKQRQQAERKNKYIVG